MTRLLRPLEWALLAFMLFVLLRAGPRVFLVWAQLGGRASTVLFSLGLVASVQLFWRFHQLPWADPRTGPRCAVWTALGAALLPWLFSVSVVLRSPLVQEELPQARAATALAALASMFMLTVGFGLPTFLSWLVIAGTIREHGVISWPLVKRRLGGGLSVFRDWQIGRAHV